MKATLHHLARPDDPRRNDPRRNDLSFLARLNGQIAWVEQVNPARGRILRQRFATALS